MINSSLMSKILLILVITGLFILALSLWLTTPDLFIYFNQAFCAH
ncbi:hypothetical protein RFH47_13890 [Acinetobacter rudis]|uniref:Signal pepetide n=1 Tax=Acinetobacter rudis TaxID=632955 RepID=A0AAW8JCZ4_9GAMM|nr:hypothetical protein [Acinetobacter rudis]